MSVAVRASTREQIPGRFSLVSKRSRRRTGLLALRIASPLAIVGIWQLLASTGAMPVETISSPVQVARAFGQLYNAGTLLPDIAISLRRAAFGLAIGVSVGTAAGILSGSWRLGEALVDSPLRMLQAVPFPAILPLFVLWFGLGEESKILFIALATAFPMYLNTFAGIRGVDRKLVEAARVLGLGRLAIVRDVVFPASLPSMLVGLRYSLVYSVMALVIAETLNASSGIGYLLTEAQQFIRTDEIMAAAVIYAVMGLAADLLVRLLERLFVPWALTFEGV